jgi:rod shape-determining protein MreC
MAVLDIRQRTGWLFMGIIVGHIILISAQVNTRRGVPMLEEATFGVFAEVQRATMSALGGVQDSWQNYFALQQVRVENEQLKTELARLRVQMQQERALGQQSRSLQALLDLRSSLQVETAAANVIGAGASAEFRTMTLDKGTQQGLKADMAVISPAGVVGRVILPTPRASKLQLLIDRNAAAGAMVERSRAQGLIMGTGSGLRLDYVSGTADVKPGDRVVTSGIDGIYPKGFVIGQIESIERGAGEFSAIVVRPAVDFTALESVLVVMTPPVKDEPPVTPEPAVATAKPGPAQ